MFVVTNAGENPSHLLEESPRFIPKGMVYTARLQKKEVKTILKTKKNIKKLKKKKI